MGFFSVSKCVFLSALLVDHVWSISDYHLTCLFSLLLLSSHVNTHVLLHGYGTVSADAFAFSIAVNKLL